MDLELKGKVAIVGGGSKGLGRACADVLAEEGASLAVYSRSPAGLERSAQSIREATGAEVLALTGDLDQAETVRHLVASTMDRFGRRGIRVNNFCGPPLARALTA